MFATRVIIALALLPATVFAQEDPVQSRRSAAAVADLQQTVKSMQADIKAMRESLEAIQDVLTEQRGPSEFSPVILHVRGIDGNPLPGFTVEMTSVRKEGREIKVSGKSDDEGLALTRQLPYGEYWINVRGPHSAWYTRFSDINVELGKPLEKVIIAPNPDERATVTLRSALDASGFEGLRFGERRRRSGSGYAIYHSPEPGEDLGHFESFPSLNNGIREVGVRVSIIVSRKIVQPDGEEREWNWPSAKAAHPTVTNLLVTPKRILAVQKVESDMIDAQEGNPYFQPVPDSRDNYNVELQTITPIEGFSAGSEISLDLVPGSVRVTLREFAGRPDVVALASLEKTQQQGTEFWLEAYIPRESEWTKQILAVDDWEPVERFSHLRQKEFILTAGEQREIVIKSPDSKK